MAVRTWLVMVEGNECIHTTATVAEAVAEVRRTWNEGDERTHCYLVTDEAGVILATLLRPAGDPELCLTTYATGRVEVHRCHYLVGGDGMYAGTAVTSVEAACVAPEAVPVGWDRV
jgi:hypothetical protein